MTKASKIKTLKSQGYYVVKGGMIGQGWQIGKVGEPYEPGRGYSTAGNAWAALIDRVAV